MSNQIDVVIQPVVLRFSLLDDEVVYFFASDTEAVLDRMELMMGINPQEDMLFDSNLGFLPVSTTVLIRGEKNIVVDPGNHHTGFYGQLAIGLGAPGRTRGRPRAALPTPKRRNRRARSGRRYRARPAHRDGCAASSLAGYRRSLAARARSRR